MSIVLYHLTYAVVMPTAAASYYFRARGTAKAERDAMVEAKVKMWRSVPNAVGYRHTRVRMSATLETLPAG